MSTTSFVFFFIALIGSLISAFWIGQQVTLAMQDDKPSSERTWLIVLSVAAMAVCSTILVGIAHAGN